MEEKTITCIVCPIGCNVVVQGEGGKITHIAGNQCKRGEEYAKNEFTHPVRILTTTVKVDNAQNDNPLVAVRSDRPIPKELLLACMEEIKAVSVKAPISRYDVVISNIQGTGVNICATGTVP